MIACHRCGLTGTPADLADLRCGNCGSTDTRIVFPDRPIVDAFVAELGSTVRSCLDCGALVAGGPVRCGRCGSDRRSVSAETRPDRLACAFENTRPIAIAAAVFVCGVILGVALTPAGRDHGYRVDRA